MGTENRSRETIYFTNNLQRPKIGHPVSEETREKLRQANIGKKATAEHRQKISNALKGKPRPNLHQYKRVGAIDKKTMEVVLEFDSIKSGAEYIGVNPSCVSSVLKGRRKSSGGYYWKYL